MNFNTFRHVATAVTVAVAGLSSEEIARAAGAVEKKTFTQNPQVHADIPATRTTYEKYYAHHKPTDNPHSLRNLIGLSF